MADTINKIPVKTEDTKAAAPVATPSTWHPIASLRREIDRLFEDFDRPEWLQRPFGSGLMPLFQGPSVLSTPAVDLVETDASFVVTAELAGLSEKDIDVTVKNGNLVISGQKEDEKEEKSKDYYVRERQFGSFERSFSLPESADSDKITATCKNGVLTVTIPKTLAAQKPAKKVEVKAA
jgi:HSP20 family protein